MESYQFYKSIYDRELNRRKDLDSAINLPLTILSIIVGANSYVIKENDFVGVSFQQISQDILLMLVLFVLGISIFYLTRSYNNLFKGFAYKNLGLTSAIREYENVELIKYNSRVEEKDKIHFDKVIIDKLTGITDNHTIFNDKRSHDLYLAKTFLIIGIILTALNFLLFSLKFLKI